MTQKMDHLHDELFVASSQPRRAFEPLVDGINGLGPGVLQTRQQAAEVALMKMGITFTLRDEGEDAWERIFPFDTDCSARTSTCSRVA